MSQKKYEITEITHPKYPWLHRIRARCQVNEQVGPGALGGYVQTEDNLSQDGTCWIYNQAICCEEAVVEDDGRMFDGAVARGSALISGDARMFERAVAEGIEVTDAYYKLGTDRVQFALNAAAGENDGQNA